MTHPDESEPQEQISALLDIGRKLEEKRRADSALSNALRDNNKDKTINELTAQYYYEPSAHLKRLIKHYKNWYEEYTNLPQSKKKIYDRAKAGRLMEQIATLAFKCIKGVDSIQTFRSFDGQYDLVVTGNGTLEWSHVNFMLGLLNELTYKIIVEAKNEDKSLPSKYFKQLAYTIENQFSDQCRIGVFFSRSSASGFPKREKNQRSLKDSRATQILFHARTNKYLIVLDHHDILRLGEHGVLILLMREKISDVENVIGTHTNLQNSYEITESNDLPPHIAEVLEDE